MTSAIDRFVRDWRQQGRMNSDATERSYRSVLWRHAEDVANRDPRYVSRVDVNRTLARWTAKPNTQSTAWSILATFYRWVMAEGHRKDNPVHQTHRPKRRPTSVYRLSRTEVVAMLGAAQSEREERAIYLGICAGLRNAELRGLRGAHFARDGLVWVSEAIAKGRRERWVPVIAELEPIVRQIRRRVALDDFVLPAQRWRDPPFNRHRDDLKKHASSSQALRTLVMRVAERAGIHAHIHPHLMRHAYADHIARVAGVRNAQFLLGHAGIATTESYMAPPTLEELTGSVAGFRFEPEARTDVLGAAERAETAGKATTRIELV